jgi:hypothetical protein
MRPLIILLALASVSAVTMAAEKTAPDSKTPAAPRLAADQPADTPAPQSTDAQVDTADQPSVPFPAEHPGDTALSQDENGNWRFRSFPALATLYVYDKDSPGTSNCRAPCASAWMPLLASRAENKPVGNWTLIARADGRHQWAYKGQPIYVRYHDMPDWQGDIQREGFSKLEP